eukprot:403339145
MSSFKQRLGNALSNQLNFSNSGSHQQMLNNQSTAFSPNQYHNQIDTSSANIYSIAGGQGLGSTGRKSVNASRITNGGGSSVLSERVHRISEKINEIHQNIEKGKSGKLEEYEKKVNLLEQQFVDGLDAAEKNFQQVDQRVQSVYQYLNNDRLSKEDLLRQKREEIAAREQEILEKFAHAEKQRFDIEKRLTKLVEERASSVQQDLQYESRNRLESIEHIKACLKSDFPKLEEMIRKEAEDREENDSLLDQLLHSEMSRLRQLIDDEKRGREETEETMIEMFKEMISKIKSEIDTEKSEREQAEEALLSLLEETCAKLNKSVAI